MKRYEIMKSNKFELILQIDFLDPFSSLLLLKISYLDTINAK